MSDKVIKMKGHVFNVGGDAKTVKGQKAGVLTAIAYLAPADTVGRFYPHLKGKSLCPNSTTGCRAACLNTAGQGAFSNVQAGRARKAALFLERKGEFLLRVADDLRKVANRAAKEGMVLHIRADGTSDVLTVYLALRLDTLLRLAGEVGRLTPRGREVLAGARWYTYTKRPASHFKGLPNVHVTYSWNEGEDNERLAGEHRAAGNNVAVVFADKSLAEAAIVRGFKGYPAIDGDADDNRADDPRGVVVALYAKGKARTDTSGFVVRALT